MTIHLKGEEPKNWSHSRYTSYVGRCPKQYELARIARAPELPSWYAIGGSAVHEVTEMIDRLWFLQGENVTAEADVKVLSDERLDALVAEAQQKSGIDPSKWLGDRRTKAHSDQWHRLVPEMVQRWIEWRTEKPWQFGVFGGEPGIELRLEVELGGLPFIAVVDRGLILPNDSLGVVDIKSGQEPKSHLQLGTYATAFELAGYERPKFGMFWMAKKGINTEPVPLDRYTKDYLDQIFGEAVEGVKRGIFPPNPGEACRMCSVAEACYSNEGNVSHLYDRLHPQYQPPEEETAA